MVGGEASVSEREAAWRELAPPQIPWTSEYVETHRAFLRSVLDDRKLLTRFVEGRSLPDRYGVGLDERVVEYPWALSRLRGGRTLDAGSVLNHEHVLDAFLPAIESLCITTLRPEPLSFPERGIDYRYEDLRTLPFDDGYFQSIVSLSTLEHVGMDNRIYGAEEPPAESPGNETERALRELERVLAPGGSLLLSVPFGRHEDHGWFRQFDESDLADLLSVSRCERARTWIFKYSSKGWQRSRVRAVRACQYRDFLACQEPVADLAAAARAVACVEITLSR